MLHQRPQPANITRDLPIKAYPVLLELLNAAEYAERCRASDWEFAVEIDSLLKEGVTTSEIRLLQRLNLVAHKVELTTIDDQQRVFEEGHSLLTAKSCFILTEPGQLAAQYIAAQRVKSTNESLCSNAPCWNAELRKLSYEGRVIKVFRSQAQNQEAILGAFEAAGWPSRINSPFPPPHSPQVRTLSDTIKCLNRSHHTKGVLRFHGDGRGKGVVWVTVSQQG